jgi:phosphotriesterase-related protein
LNTARGSIDTADLGVTLMHEHVFVLSPEIIDNYPDVWGDEAKRELDAIARLNELKTRGVDSIVDLTVIGLGRYIPRIARIAEQTDINIVHAGKMVLSHDASCFIDHLPEKTRPVVMPNWHYLHIHNDVIPALKRRGVTDEQLETMLVGNPRKIFETRGGY